MTKDEADTISRMVAAQLSAFRAEMPPRLDMKAMGKGVVEAIKPRILQMEARIAELEARLGIAP
jgi:hypothetical protein